MATVPENCHIVIDSLCHARRLLLSSITRFVITKITQTNFANQNLHGHKFRSLPCQITLQTRYVVFQREWTQFVLSETTKYCSALKRPLMCGDWKRVWVKLFCTDLNLSNPDLHYKLLWYFSIFNTYIVQFLFISTERHHHVVTTLKRGERVDMSKQEIEKLTHLGKQVFFLNCFCP